MSNYGYCQGGGIHGVRVGSSELEWFASHVADSDFMDEYIPLPDLDGVEQKKVIKKGKDTCPVNHDLLMEDYKAAFAHVPCLYWETEKGSHGWCCPNCGKVIQWG